MRVLIITPYYPPIASSLSNMMKELAQSLAVQGHQVTVATAWLPNKLSKDADFREYKVFSDEKNVKILRIRAPFLNNNSYILRGMSQLMLPHLYWRNIKKYLKSEIDVVMAYTPPLTFSTLGRKIKKKYGARYLLNVQDIFPQNAIDLGILKNKATIKYFERIEKRGYKAADEITSHTETSRKFLIEKKEIPEKKIHYIPNWIDPEPYKIAEKNNKFRRKYGLVGKFVFLFAGVVGPSQGLDLIINIAREIKNDLPDVSFLIVGGGTEKSRLAEMSQRFSLNNVVFKPWVSLEEYPELLKEVDVGMVCLSSKNKTPVIPAKILGYMASSLPIVAFLNKESDGHAMINEAKCGYAVTSDCDSRALNIIKKIYSERDKLSQYGANARQYVTEKFSKDVCIGKFDKLMESS